MLINVLLAHICNLLIRKYTKYKKTNYFFTMSPDGNGPLELFYKRIPVPFVYAIPIVIIFGIGFLIVITLFKLIALRI